MTTAMTTHSHVDRAPVRRVSLLAIVIVALCVLCAVKQYEADLVLVAAVNEIDGTILVGAAAIWLVYGIVAIGAVVRLQRYAVRPGWSIALGLAFGALVATYVAALANAGADTLSENLLGEGAAIYLTTPVVEESIKGVGVIALMLVPVLARFGPLEGLFYGVIVGAGFQVLEDFIYSLTTAESSPDAAWAAVMVNVFIRAVFGVFSHAVWTGILGAAIGAAALGGPGRARRVGIAIATFALVMVLHGFDDRFGGDFSTAALDLGSNLVGLVILVVVLLRLQKREKARLTELAVANDGWGVLDPAALSVAERGRSQRKRRRLELRFAYAREQYGPHGRLTRRAEARLAGS